VWPLESSAREYLRVGRESLERWSGRSGRLDCVAHHELPARAYEHAATAPGAELQAALRVLYADKPLCGVTLLVESALMPTLLLEAGLELWTPTQMTMLLRHRLSSLYAKPGATTAAWDVRIDFLAGESHGLGFGMDSSLRYTLVQACSSAGIKCRALLPALAWGLNRLQSMRYFPERGWLAWAEQDRLLLTRVEAGRVRSLNAAAMLTTDSSTIMRQIEIEQLRCGVPPAEAIVATTWNASPAGQRSTTEGLIWLDIGREVEPRAAPDSALSRKWVRQS